ncbi:MAG: hypothetical protein ACR2RV_19270 [Verrucomicrobiales bacterium]
MMLHPALALAMLLAIPSAQADEEDIAYFEKTYGTKITGVRAIEKYPHADQFYTAIAQQLGISEKALKAVKAKGWKEDPEKIQKTDIKRLPDTTRWQVTFHQIRLDRKTNSVERRASEVVRVELDDEGKAHHVDLSKQEAEGLKAKEQKKFDGILAMMLKMQRIVDENPDQDPLELGEQFFELGEKFVEILDPAELELLKELALEEAAPAVDKVPEPPVAIAPTGLTLVVCDSSNKVLDTILIPRAQEAITYRISVPKGMEEVRTFAIGKGRILGWLSEDLTENYCEARTDDQGSNSWGRMDATVKDFQFKGFSGTAGMKPLNLTEEMLKQIEEDIAEDKRAPFVTIISEGNQGGANKEGHSGTKDSLVEEDAVRAAMAHVRSFLKADFKNMKMTYAARVKLMPGSEMLKAEYGFAGENGLNEEVTVDRTELLAALEKVSGGRPLVKADSLDKLFKAFSFKVLTNRRGDYAVDPPDPVGTPDNKLHFAIEERDVLIKVGPEKGDFLLFQFRQIDGGWRVVAEYLD